MNYNIKIRDPFKCILWAACIFFLTTSFSFSGEKRASLINCDIQSGSCSQQLKGYNVILEVLPKPVKAMEALVFKITFEGQSEYEQPYIDLNMPAMNMGKNRVMLNKTGNGHYEGKGTIVRCRSGRRTWSAKVVFPGIGNTEFIFDVIY